MQFIQNFSGGWIICCGLLVEQENKKEKKKKRFEGVWLNSGRGSGCFSLTQEKELDSRVFESLAVNRINPSASPHSTLSNTSLPFPKKWRLSFYSNTEKEKLGLSYTLSLQEINLSYPSFSLVGTCCAENNPKTGEEDQGDKEPLPSFLELSVSKLIAIHPRNEFACILYTDFLSSFGLFGTVNNEKTMVEGICISYGSSGWCFFSLHSIA